MVFGYLIRFLVLMVLVRMAWKFLTGLVGGVTTRPQVPPTEGISLVRDPVCGTHLDRTRAVTVRLRGEMYYFCSEDCRAAFDQGSRAASGGA